mgnify:CR=1 FL=1
MSKYRNLIIGTAMTAISAAPAFAERFGLGRAALPEEVAAWNVDVSPDGTGLPEGSGSVEDGEMLFSESCAVCHGEFAEGVDNWPKLAGGQGTLDRKDPLKTVGSYWPYLSTAWDYVHRSMPFGNAQSLSADETYAIVAYILYSNDLVDDDFVLSKENFLEVEMPNADGFIIDDREEAEKSFWGEPCMTDCKSEVKITMRAAVLDVTPDEEGAEEASMDEGTTETPAAEEAKAEPAAAPAEEAVAALDADLVATGEKVFKKCKACHQVGDGAKNKTGPILNGIYNSAVASVDGFKYSKTFKSMAEEGMVWDDANLAGFLAKPRKFAKGTKMSFAGLKKDKDIAAITEYLKSVSQ